METQPEQESVEPEEQVEPAAEQAGAVPLNRAERRHGGSANHPDNRPMPGKRGSFAGPFHAPGPGQKRTHSHRKTG